MTFTSSVYPLALRHLSAGRFGDLAAADLRVMLCRGGYVPADTDEWASTPGGFETLSVTYPVGGLALSGVAVDSDAQGLLVTCAPVSVGAADFTARWAVVFVRNPGGYGASPLLSRVDFGADVAPAGDDFTLTFSGGLLRIGGLG